MTAVTHGLELGALDLVTDTVHDDGYQLSVHGEDATFGASQAVIREIVSMLADGNHVKYDRAGNRVVSFDVAIEALDGKALQAGEVALRRELYRPNTVTWTPPAYLSEPTVFEIVASEMSPQFDDIEETLGQRVFRVTLTCAPYARSKELTTVTAASVPGTETAVTFDTCDSATGWTAKVNGVTTAVDTAWQAGAVSVYDLLTPGPQNLSLTRAGAVDFTTTRYLVAEIGYNATLGALPVTCLVDGARNLTLLDQRLISAGRFLYTFDTGAINATTSLTFSSYSRPDFADLKIYSLKRTDMPPSVTPRQLARIITPGGTERTPASIRVTSPDGVSDLGLTLVHTSPEDGSGYSPPLRRWRVSGNMETPDASTISGKRESLSYGGVYNIFEVPDTALPEGGYALIGLMRSSSAYTGNIQIVSDTFQSGTQLPGGEVREIPVDLHIPNDWTLVDLGVYSIPTARTVSGATLRIAMGGPPTVEYDELWLFRVDGECGLTIVLTDKANLWLDSPTVEDPAFRWWEGDTESRAGARFPVRWYALGQHILSQPATRVFTAASGLPYTKLDASLYRRWPNNAGE